jgi:hypothetical protein
LTTLRKTSNSNNPYSVALLNPESILSIKSADDSKTLNLSDGQVMLVCYGRPVTGNDLNLIEQPNKKNNINSDLVIKNLLQGDSIRIFPDGNYANTLRMASVNSSDILLGLTMRLPVGYSPEALALSAVETENIINFDKIDQHFEEQIEVFPQEKIYLHTDKPYYISGERIWLRAYLADAATHYPVSYSRYVYVELINPLDTIVTRVKIREEEGAYHGYLSIPADAPEGDYTLRAYTTFMRSQEENYLFTQPVHISDPQSRVINTDTQFFFESDKNGRIQTIQIPTPDDDFDVSFYPEGGSLLQGTSCMVGFKAMKSNGQATHISGMVYDRKGNEILSFKSEHLGMGRFMLYTEKGNTYYSVCQNDKGQSKRFELPASINRGYALTVSSYGDDIHVSVLKTAEFTQNNDLYLLAHTRGVVQFAGLVDHKNPQVVLPSELFPSGVLHFILFDGKLNPVSERLVFVNNPDQAQVTFQPDQENYVRRSLVKNRVLLTDNDGEPLTGNFSVAVTSDSAVSPDSTSNILTHFLLTSDLHGNIENPAYYFQNTHTSAYMLDLLMLTQGWRRYNIAELAKGRFAEPTMPVEVGLELTGTVKSLMLGRPIEEVIVTAVSLTGGFMNSALTDKNGRFELPVGEYPDSTLFMVNIDQKRGLIGMELFVDEETFPQRTLPAAYTSEVDKYRLAKYADMAGQQYIAENGERVYELPELTVTAQRILPRVSPFYTTPSNSITEEELEKIVLIDNIYDLLKRFPSVRLSSNGLGSSPRYNIVLRGVAWSSVIAINSEGNADNQANNSTNPLVLLDNIPYDMDILDMINVNNIKRIDILNQPPALFSSRGINGVIAIYTKPGSSKSEDLPVYHIKSVFPLGYQTPVEFYAPKYDTPEKRNIQASDLRTTIHWQPVVQTDSTGVASFEFYTADERTSYTVVIEGLSDDGKIITQVEKIVISY